jgi:tetraacyldisaccharide 4'-kinase
MKAILQAWLLRIWRQRGLWAVLLWPLSLVYAWLQTWVSRLQRARAGRVPACVIVVGNVVAGGGGKTPLTLALVHHLGTRGLKAAVVSRGYGRQDTRIREVSVNSPPRLVGDEPLLIHRLSGVPVWVGSQRLATARALLQAHPDVQVIVSDDGLQHLALERDVEICVMDERGIGNGWLLPAGPLRERWPRAVDLLVHPPGAGFERGHVAQRALAAFAIDARGRQVSLASLTHAPVDALAGIARPETFFAMLTNAGLQLRSQQRFADHAPLTDWQAPPDGTVVLCTEKDAVKLWPYWPEVLAVPLQLTLPESFWMVIDQRVDTALSKPRTGI